MSDTIDHAACRVEWIRRGDGTWVLYLNGSVCAEPEEIQAHPREESPE